MTGFVPQPTCPVCSDPGRRTVGKRGDRPLPRLLAGEPPEQTVDIVACRRCGHYFCDPVPAVEHLASLYADASSYFAGTPEGRLTGALGFMRDLIERSGSATGRLLDIGSGEGYLLEAARTSGWSATGIEPTDAFAAVATARGLDVHVGYLDPSFEPTELYDAVCAVAVLEHVPDPVGFLCQARRVCRPGGLLFLEVPNGRRPEAFLVDTYLRLRRTPWTVRTAPLQEPFHLSEFTTTSLRTAMRRSGFEPVELKALPGHVPYPLPAAADRVVRAVERIGDRFGAGLNLVAVGRAVDPTLD